MVLGVWVFGTGFLIGGGCSKRKRDLGISRIKATQEKLSPNQILAWRCHAFLLLRSISVYPRRYFPCPFGRIVQKMQFALGRFPNVCTKHYPIALGTWICQRAFWVFRGAARRGIPCPGFFELARISESLHEVRKSKECQQMM